MKNKDNEKQFFNLINHESIQDEIKRTYEILHHKIYQQNVLPYLNKNVMTTSSTESVILNVKENKNEIIKVLKYNRKKLMKFNNNIREKNYNEITEDNQRRKDKFIKSENDRIIKSIEENKNKDGFNFGIFYNQNKRKPFDMQHHNNRINSGIKQELKNINNLSIINPKSTPKNNLILSYDDYLNTMKNHLNKSPKDRERENVSKKRKEYILPKIKTKYSEEEIKDRGSSEKFSRYINHIENNFLRNENNQRYLEEDYEDALREKSKIPINIFIREMSY